MYAIQTVEGCGSSTCDERTKRPARALNRSLTHLLYRTYVVFFDRKKSESCTNPCASGRIQLGAAVVILSDLGDLRYGRG